MSTLAQGWTITSIGNVTCAIEQREPSGDNEFLYIDISAIDRDTKTISAPQRLSPKNAPSRARKVVRVGDVLVSMTRPNLNAVAMVDASLDGEIASTGFDVLRGIELDPRWLYYSVRSYAFVDAMSSLVQGALYPAIKSTDVRKFEIPLAPLAEQKRIADKLDSMLERVDACRKRLDCIPLVLKRLRQSILSAATSGALTADWRDHAMRKNTQHKYLTASNTSSDADADTAMNDFSGITFELPKSWKWKNLAAGISQASYGTSSKSMSKGSMPVLRMGNLQGGKLDWDNLVYSENEQDNMKYALAPGDLLFNRTNSPELVGKTSLYIGERPAIYAGYLIRVRCKPDLLLSEYVNFCLNSPYGRAYCYAVKSDGVSQSNINAEKLRAFPVPFCDVTEQTEIIRRVEILFAFADRLQGRLAAARTATERLTPALLAKAFRGELVPQDPNDEPASELLKRLAASRAEHGDKPRRGRIAKV
jgi:type I restriction enzyme S subunit